MNEHMNISPERKLWNDGPNYTADAVIVDETAQKILLIKRGDCGQWALPGGFVDASDSSSREAAKREAMEEANIELVGSNDEPPLYRGIVDDPRNSEDAWIETSAYLFSVDAKTETTAGDDAVDTKWFAFNALPKLYASHEQIVARALDLISSRRIHREFYQRPDRSIQGVSGGHMGYQKNLHTTGIPEALFEKTFGDGPDYENDQDTFPRDYLEKEAKVMAHLRTSGYRHLPQHSSPYGPALVMEGLAPEHGWHWRAPIDETERYIDDCLQAFDELEAHHIFPDTDVIEPPLESFTREGWAELTDEKCEALQRLVAFASPHFRASTRQSLEHLLEELPVLRSASRTVHLPSRYVLSHHDARQSNIAWHPAHGVRLVDWSWTGLGRPGSDATSFLIDMHKSGHDVTNYLDRISPEHCLTLIGFWLEHSTRPTRESSHDVRRQQLLSAISGYEVLSLLSAEG